MSQNNRLTVRDIAVLGMMVALIEAVKRALDAIPNVEMVTFLFIIFTLCYGKKVILAALAFTAIETVYWGPNTWVIMYIYIWPLLVLVVDLFRKHAGVWFCSLLAGAYGLLFGLMCSVVYLFIGGPAMMFTWWVAGIPYDILHCVSNFVICFVLYRPARAAVSKTLSMTK